MEQHLQQLKQLAFTVDEARQVSRIGRNEIYLAIKRGELRAIRVGRKVVIPAAALEAWLDELASKAAV